MNMAQPKTSACLMGLFSLIPRPFIKYGYKARDCLVCALLNRQSHVYIPGSAHYSMTGGGCIYMYVGLAPMLPPLKSLGTWLAVAVMFLHCL